MQRHGDHDEVGEQYTGDKTYQGTRAEDPDVFLLVTGQPQRNKLPDLIKKKRRGDENSGKESNFKESDVRFKRCRGDKKTSLRQGPLQGLLKEGKDVL